MASPIALQSTAVSDQLSDAREHWLNRACNYEIQFQLEEAESNLTWWISLDRKVPVQSSILSRISSMTIESDASNKGWGARQGELSTGGRWSQEESSHHINYLELLAAFLALQSFAKHSRSMTIQMKMDNVTAVAYINKLGATHSPLLCQLVLTIREWSLQRKIFLVAEHLPGKENVAADQESRLMKDRCDWMLNPQVFSQIQQAMGLLQIDLFASRLTKQLPIFYSWRPDPEAQGTDAFNQDWSQRRGFANPPWCLIARCLSQVKKQVATRRHKEQMRSIKTGLRGGDSPTLHGA